MHRFIGRFPLFLPDIHTMLLLSAIERICIPAYSDNTTMLMPSKKQKITSNQIRRYRRRRNLKLRQVATLVGLRSVSHVSHWEKGRKLPTLQNALKLSAIIKCPVEVLFFDLFDSIRREILTKQRSQLSKHDDQYPTNTIHPENSSRRTCS